MINKDIQEQVQIQNWASEVAMEKGKRERTISRESKCIDSSKTIERQKDIFYSNHKFERKK